MEKKEVGLLMFNDIIMKVILIVCVLYAVDSVMILMNNPHRTDLIINIGGISLIIWIMLPMIEVLVKRIMGGKNGKSE